MGGEVIFGVAMQSHSLRAMEIEAKASSPRRARQPAHRAVEPLWAGGVRRPTGRPGAERRDKVAPRPRARGGLGSPVVHTEGRRTIAHDLNER